MPGRKPDPSVRSRILDAADRLMVRTGYQKMTIDAVAAEASIGKGSVYLHFDSKEEVALSCLDRMVDELLEQLRELATDSRPVPERLRAMLCLRVLHRFDYARKHAHSIDQKLASMRAAMLERRARHFRLEAEVFGPLLVRTADPEATAEALITGTNALLPYSLSVRELGRRTDLLRRTEQVVRLLVAGVPFLSQRPSPSRRHTRPQRRTP